MLVIFWRESGLQESEVRLLGVEDSGLWPSGRMVNAGRIDYLQRQYDRQRLEKLSLWLWLDCLCSVEWIERILVLLPAFFWQLGRVRVDLESHFEHGEWGCSVSGILTV